MLNVNLISMKEVKQFNHLDNFIQYKHLDLIKYIFQTLNVWFYIAYMIVNLFSTCLATIRTSCSIGSTKVTASTIPRNNRNAFTCFLVLYMLSIKCYTGQHFLTCFYCAEQQYSLMLGGHPHPFVNNKLLNWPRRFSNYLKSYKGLGTFSFLSLLALFCEEKVGVFLIQLLPLLGLVLQVSFWKCFARCWGRERKIDLVFP